MSHRVKGVLRILMILVGNFLDALGFVLFVSATGLITGGSSGVGLLFHRAFELYFTLRKKLGIW